MYFDFTTSNGLQITPGDEKKRGKHEKEDKRAEVKRDIPFYLYIVDFLWERKKRLISVFMKMHSYRKQ